MILPTKNINFSKSLLGFGSYVLSVLDDSQSIDDLWQQYQKDYKNKKYPGKHTFDNLIMTLIFLYAAGCILEQEGLIKRCA